MDKSTHQYLNPSSDQVEAMKVLRDAAQAYQEVLEKMIPEGPDKTFVIRNLRTTAMWANVAITRHPDGSPR